MTLSSWIFHLDAWRKRAIHKNIGEETKRGFTLRTKRGRIPRLGELQLCWVIVVSQITITEIHLPANDGVFRG